MILGFVIDEHGNLITGQQVDQIMADVQQWAEDVAPAFEQITQICEQAAAAFAEFGAAAARAYEEIFQIPPAEWPQLLGHSGETRWEHRMKAVRLVPLDDRELAYRAYAQAYNWEHAGRRISWRRLSVLQRALASAQWLDVHGWPPEEEM